MSASGLTSQAQVQYILQWFQEFSDLQREDFLPVLASAQGNRPEQLAAILSNLSCQDKPVSLFQCRVKLFNEWFPSWSDEEKGRLIKKISELDPEFSKKLKGTELQGTQMNGDENDSDANNAEVLAEAPESHNVDQDGKDIIDDNREFSSSNPENVSIEITAAS
ncbi:unnamed protein product, partial [Iphiclides podalirius]